jgi:bacteriorhodopsin
MTATSVERRVATYTDQTTLVRRFLRAGLTAAFVGVAVVEAYAVLVKAAGVQMTAGFLGATHARPVTAGSFATGVLVCTFWGTVIALVLRKLSRHPRQTFLLVSSGLTALSLAVPFGAGATAASTKVTLAAAHVLAASVVIPILARTLDVGDDYRRTR